MSAPYAGPLRDEPLAVELHNTRYATSAGPVDALADAEQAQAWLQALADRLPGADGAPGAAACAADLIALRDAVRAALQAAAGGSPQDPASLATINEASRRAARSPRAELEPGETAPRRAEDTHGASRAEITAGAFARDAIDLLTGPHRADLRVCGAPGCILMFVKEHPRREWCSSACGNRARQARHYQRAREIRRGPAPTGT
jgi:predicted RNA-binding Zn ribbon-like protein